MTYFLAIFISLIVLTIFVTLFLAFVFTYGFYEGCENEKFKVSFTTRTKANSKNDRNKDDGESKDKTIEQWQNFQPMHWTNVKKIPYIHYNYFNPEYTRENLLAGELPIDEHTLTIGISERNKNTLHRYILNHLIKKTILYQSKQFKVLDIDYKNDYQVLLDLNNYKLNYGIVSAPVLYDYLIVRNQAYKTNLEFLTALSYNFVYGLTLANRQIYTIYDLKGATIGITKNNATERLVIRDFMNNIKNDIGNDYRIYETEHTQLLDRLYDGTIDFFIIIDEFPSDIIRNLLSKNRPLQLVDMNMNNHMEFISKYPYERARLNTKLLDYTNRNIFSHEHQGRYLPVHPHILTYKFQNYLLTNNGNRMVRSYELIRDIYRRLTNNIKIGLGYFPENYLQRHVSPGLTRLPIPMHPSVKDLHTRITYHPEII